MSQVLIDKMRRARERAVQADGRTFTIRRPTEAQSARLAGSDVVTYLGETIVGWDVKEIDLVPGGSSDPVPFDAALFREWIADQPTLWKPLVDGVLDEIERHRGAREENAKN